MNPPDKLLNGLKLLLAEDYADAQLLVRRRLQSLGAEVDVASDGIEAVDKALHREYDAILMDIQMPGLDGYEATESLRAKHYTKPIIALTAHSLREEQQRILRSGFDGYIAKPLERDALVSEIRKVTGHSPSA